MKKNNLLFIKPANLDLEKLILEKESITIKAFQKVEGRKLLRDKTFKPKSLIRHLKYCYYFIDLIYKRKNYNRDKYRHNDYVHIKKDILYCIF